MLAERDSLIKGLSQVLSPPPSNPIGEGILHRWHDRSRVRFLQLVEQIEPSRWPVPYAKHHYQMSYRLVLATKPEISTAKIPSLLAQANRETLDRVNTGWSLFYPFDRREIAPYIFIDTENGAEIEICETNLMVEADIHLDFWRVRTDGLATIFQPYREDRIPVADRVPGTWLSPRMLCRELTELVTHAVAMGKLLGELDAVEFRLTWRGLENRYIADPDPGTNWRRRVSRTDSRTIDGTFAYSRLIANWPDVVAELANPILRLFDGLEISGDFVRKIAPTFKQF